MVDVQNDFLPGGALAVPDGDAVIPPLNRCAAAFDRDGLPIFATRDWHPPDHCSFRARGGPWPTHGVAGTRGAEFPLMLALPRSARVVSKATGRDGEAYSGFRGTDLAEQMKALKCARVDAVRAVNVQAGDGERAMREMICAGMRLCSADEAAA